MTTAELLVMLEAQLEIITDYMDAAAKSSKEAELTQYLNAAQRFIEKEGAVLDLADIGHCMIVVMYAAWLYNRRLDPTAQMPRMIRWNLNNLIFSQKAVVPDADA